LFERSSLSFIKLGIGYKILQFLSATRTLMVFF
jgi:hypothetical protein